MKEKGSNGATFTEKMLDYLSLSDLSVCSIAINLLTSGCEKILEKFFGSNNAQEIRKQDDWINEFAENIKDTNQREQAIKFGNIYRKVFSMILRYKRREYKDTLNF